MYVRRVGGRVSVFLSTFIAPKRRYWSTSFCRLLRASLRLIILLSGPSRVAINACRPDNTRNAWCLSWWCASIWVETVFRHANVRSLLFPPRSPRGIGPLPIKVVGRTKLVIKCCCERHTEPVKNAANITITFQQRPASHNRLCQRRAIYGSVYQDGHPSSDVTNRPLVIDRDAFERQQHQLSDVILVDVLVSVVGVTLAHVHVRVPGSGSEQIEDIVTFVMNVKYFISSIRFYVLMNVFCTERRWPYAHHTH